MDQALSFEQQVDVFLATCRTASLATVDGAGQPHAANVQYVHEAGWGLWWVSSPGAAHSRNLERDARAAVTVYAHMDEPANIHGLQMRGRVDEGVALGNAAWERAWTLYTAKYPFVRDEPKMREAAERQRFYRFVPTWVRWIDNRRGFGFKVEKVVGG